MTDHDPLTLAYLAGAIDSDGYIFIKRSRWNVGTGKPFWNPSYDGRIGLTQVTLVVQTLLKATFGGYVYVGHTQQENRRATTRWIATGAKAVAVCRALIPYLRIKRRQAELVAELGETRDLKWRYMSSWFELEHTDWQTTELMTLADASVMLGYRAVSAVHTAIYKRTLLAVPNRGNRPIPRIPRALVEAVAAARQGRRAQVRPPQLTAWRERLYQECRTLNSPGITGHPGNRREGVFAERTHSRADAVAAHAASTLRVESATA